MSQTVRAYLSLGSNLGDRVVNLARAAASLETGRESLRQARAARMAGEPSDGRVARDLIIAAVSPIYETAPIGESGTVVTDQPSYLNCAIAIDTNISPAELRAITVGIEHDLGRGKHARWQPRTIDIDLVIYGDERIATPTLTVPHPRMAERAFVLKPIVDLDADITAPGIGRLADLLPMVASQGCALHTAAADFQDLVDEQLLELGTD